MYAGQSLSPGLSRPPCLACPHPLQDEKEQLNEYRGHLSGLAKRAKAIVQLKPRNPAHPVRGHVPLQAVCDYKQVEVSGTLGTEACELGVWAGCVGGAMTALATTGDGAQGGYMPAAGPRAVIPLASAEQLGW